MLRAAPRRPFTLATTPRISSRRPLSAGATLKSPPQMTAPPPYASWRLNPPTSTPSSSLTLKNQPLLPRLPVPALAATLDKLVQSTRALGTEEEVAEVRRKAEEFRQVGGVGEELQKRLEARREQPGVRNWISEWWDTDGYMAYRDSVVINVSYYFGFNKLPQGPQSSTSKSDPAYVAASIATTALSFRNLIAKGLLEPESAGKSGGELCMESYKWAFNACRVPATPSDCAVKIPELSPEGQHVVVVRGGRFWSVPLEVGGTEVGVEGLRKAFQSILDQDLGPTEAPRVGILTAVNRDLWSSAHAKLLSSSPTNVETLKAIETSAFVVAFDASSPEPAAGTSTDGICEFSRRIWTGQTVKEGGNRWWDKPLQWIVFANGEAGFVGEHSCMDGTPTARLNDFLSKRLLSPSTPVAGTEPFFTTSAPTPLELPFVVEPAVENLIEQAETEFAAHVAGYDLKYLRYDRYGKDGIKAMGVSPDAWTQMLFQIAFKLTHGHNCATYEAAQVRLFQLGRTETIRIATVASRDFVDALLALDSKEKDGEGVKKVKALFLAATGQHGRDAKEAASGQGVDRHLFGLRKVLKLGEKADLLSDPLVKRSASWTMSTSQIYIRNAPAYGWGPVVDDGYGLPYMIHPECLQFTVTCRKSTPGLLYVENLAKAADLLMDVMERAAGLEKGEGGSHL